MKINKLVVLFFVFGFVLAACGKKATPTLPLEVPRDLVDTAVALTITAQVKGSTATVTLTPPPTIALTPQASATSVPTMTPTLVVAAPATVVKSGSICDDSIFLSDVTIPDGKIMAPGQSFTKTWSLKNTGTCEWKTSYSLVFVSGTVMGGTTTKLEASVSPGKSTQVSVKMVAPSTTGSYTGFWKLQNSAGNFFGQSVYVQIVVSKDAATLTPTPTKTSATSRTPTVTSTTGSISTSGPTATQTLTPTPKPTGSVTPTSTSEPTVTPTLTATNSPEPTVTPTNTLEPTLTPTP